MNPLALQLLADENIHPDVIAGMRKRRHDVRTVGDEGLIGSDDVVILRRAHAAGRIVVTTIRTSESSRSKRANRTPASCFSAPATSRRSSC